MKLLISLSAEKTSKKFSEDDRVVVKVSANEWHLGRVVSAGRKLEVEFDDGYDAVIDKEDLKDVYLAINTKNNPKVLKFSEAKKYAHKDSGFPRRLYEGFWSNGKSDTKSPFPFPVKNVRKWTGQDAFVKKLIDVEKKANSRRDKGYSTCRICRANNGAGTYGKGDWSWPEGFRHYITEHNVKPSQDFIDFVNGKNKEVDMSGKAERFNQVKKIALVWKLGSNSDKDIIALTPLTPAIERWMKEGLDFAMMPPTVAWIAPRYVNRSGASFTFALFSEMDDSDEGYINISAGQVSSVTEFIPSAAMKDYLALVPEPIRQAGIV